MLMFQTQQQAKLMTFFKIVVRQIKLKIARQLVKFWKTSDFLVSYIFHDEVTGAQKQNVKKNQI